jgi:hypothetical protein
MAMDAFTVLAARRDFITSQRLLSEDALNWPIFCTNYLHYIATRTAFLEHRRHVRALARLRVTAAALAEAETEVARLRSVLVEIKLLEIEYATSLDGDGKDSYAEGCLAGVKYCAHIARAALETAPAGEA